MKEHLLQLFRYTDWANKLLLAAIHPLPDKEEAIKLFSHLITSQNKWMNRITKVESDEHHNWFGPIFKLEDLDGEWQKSVNAWIEFLERSNEEDLEKEIVINRNDGKTIRVKIKDVALQLNFHSIHHRAQTLRLIRQQGQTPPITDYIHTVLKIG